MAEQRVKSKDTIDSSKAGPIKAKNQALSQTPKVLRIGINQEGKIVEERIIRKRDTVTVGQSEKSTFVISSPDLPSRFEMFESKSGGGGGSGYTLQFTEAMQGRVSFDGAVRDLDELRRSGEAQKKGKIFRLDLSENARGKLVVGDSSILFQFVTPPPIQPRPQLPAAVRGGIFRSVEWSIAVIWIVSFMIHAGFLIYIKTTDWPVVTKWDQYLQLKELITVVDAKPEKEKKTDKGEGETEESKEETKEEEKTTKKKEPKEEETPKKSAEEIAQERAEKRAAIADQLAQRGINKIIGSLGGTGEGAIMDVLGQGDVGADQDALLAQVAGVGVATGDSQMLRGPAGGKGGGEAADIGQVKMKGGDAAVKTGGAGAEREVKVTVKRKDASAVDGTGALNPQEVNRVIGQKMGAIKGCYERALRRDPNIKGKLVIRFTISGSGKVSSAKIVENDLTPEVGDCVVSRFESFRFPAPDGGSLTMESPFMFMPAN